MRYVTYVLSPERGYFDLGERIMRENGVYPRAIHDFEFLEDETVVQQMAVGGDRDAIDDCFSVGDGGVVDYQVIDAGDATVLQLHYTPSPLTRELMAIHRRHAVVLDYPLTYVGPENRGLRVSEIGREEELRAVIAETRDAIDVEIEGLGSYDPTAGGAFGSLTDRQREVLHTAVEAGYYEVPRRVTYEEIADQLGCSAGAVGQHLRRIEAAIMSEVTTGSGSVVETTTRGR